MQETQSISGAYTRACVQCLWSPLLMPSPPGIAAPRAGSCCSIHPGCVQAMDESQVGMGLARPSCPGQFLLPEPRAKQQEGHLLCSASHVGSAQWREAVGQLLGSKIRNMAFFSVEECLRRERRREKGERSFHKLLSNEEEQALFWGTWRVGTGMAERTDFQIFLLFSCVCMGGKKFGPIWTAEENQWRFLSIVLL